MSGAKRTSRLFGVLIRKLSGSSVDKHTGRLDTLGSSSPNKGIKFQLYQLTPHPNVELGKCSSVKKKEEEDHSMSPNCLCDEPNIHFSLLAKSVLLALADMPS